MEFEKNKPTTAEDIALADAPKVVLQPFNVDIRAEPVNSNYSHLNEASFKFETESTDEVAHVQRSSTGNHKTTTVIVAMLCVSVIVITSLIIYYFQ